jgi:hypothetical protein
LCRSMKRGVAISKRAVGKLDRGSRGEWERWRRRLTVEGYETCEQHLALYSATYLALCWLCAGFVMAYLRLVYVARASYTGDALAGAREMLRHVKDLPANLVLHHPQLLLSPRRAALSYHDHQITTITSTRYHCSCIPRVRCPGSRRGEERVWHRHRYWYAL